MWGNLWIREWLKAENILLEAKKSRHANNIYLCRILKAIKPEKTENTLLTYDKTYIKAKYGKDVEL